MGGYYARRAECLIKQGKIKAKEETNEEAEYENLSALTLGTGFLTTGKNFIGDENYRSVMKQNSIDCWLFLKSVKPWRHSWTEISRSNITGEDKDQVVNVRV